MKSLTIYLDEENFEKVIQIVKLKKITTSDWYREITELEINNYNENIIPESKQFLGMAEKF